GRITAWRLSADWPRSSSLAGGICHILVGPRAAALSQALQPLLRR
ncbi:hypothetical protein K3Z96_26020, partial [Pseudomonas aeruginosa]|nr:hypothetical protein [Pseudomonas aeruginosa]